MVSDIYRNEIQLKKTNSWNVGTSFLDVHITINNNSIHTNMYYKRDYFDFCTVNYPHFDGDVPHATSVSQLIRFTRACSNEKDFNERHISFSFPKSF
jgi:hypothetical protein